MVTENCYKKDDVYFSSVTLYGLSTDTKPLSYGNGSVFIEVDTGSAFFFDAENGKWYPEPEPEPEPDPNTRKTKKK